jgi:thioredoxin reductase (NADPH)
VVTAEEIAQVPLFAAVPEEERRRLSQAAADLRLLPGEWAVNEGDERALFVLLEGKVETVKLVDGIERVIGGRVTNDVIGEVPVVLGTPFPAGFRATEPSRVMRIEVHDYHALAAVVPQVAEQVGALARARIGALQNIVADAPPRRAVVIGNRLDAACSELRRFLDRNQISFEWVVPDDPGGDYPLLRVTDGATLVRPPLRDVAELLGLDTRADRAEYDVVVIGGGPAGLAAAVYGASEGLSTVVVEREAPGGQAGTSSRIENYLGFPSGVSGDELASRALQQARRLGAEILVTRAITALEPEARLVHLDGGDVLHGRTIILATGVAWRQLAIKGFERLIGKGIQYGAARSEAANTHGLDVHIIGAGNSAGQAALFFAAHAREVTILCRGDSLEKSMSHYLVEQLQKRANIAVAVGSEVVGVHGETSLSAIDVRHGDGEVVCHESGGLFVFIGADAETGWLPPEIALDARGYVLTGADVRATGGWPLERDPYLLETSVPGIFACGDVRSGPVKRVAAAVGEGSMAIAFVHQYLQSLIPA